MDLLRKDGAIIMWKKITAVLLLIAGGILIFSGQINEKYIDHQVQQVSKEAYAITPTQIKENNERVLPDELEEERFDFTQVEAINVNETWQTLLQQVMETDSVAPNSDADTTPAISDETPGPGEPVTKPVSQEVAGTDTGTETGTGTKVVDNKDDNDAGQGSNGTQAPSGMTDEQAKKELKKYAEKQIIGIIKAPSVGLEVGVLKGVLNRTLMLGAGTMRPDQVMGQGNYSVITHRTRRPGLLFSGVPKMKSGQLVYITDKETIYTYKVYDRFNVHQSETDVIYDEVSDKRGKPVLTLVTCFSLNDPEARVIVHAELVNSQPYTAEVFADLK